MKLLPSIDVVVCTYADERWRDVERALESLREQTLAPSKVVLVVDHNPGLAARATSTFTDVAVVPSEGTGGLSSARNTGLAQCSSEVVAFLDDDAVADSCWLEQLARRYEDPGVLGVGGKIEASWPDHRPRWFPDEFGWVTGCSYRGQPETEASVRNLIGANMSLRREILTAIGGFSADIGQVGGGLARHDDTELCIRALTAFPGRRLVYAPDALVTHTVLASRTRWRYFVSRCYGEGVSKAAMTRMTGSGIGLQAERDYLRRALPRGVGRGLLDVLRGDLSGAMRSVAIVIGLAATVAGYVRGSLSSTATTVANRHRGASSVPAASGE
jgi:GT2 family glycosyltransferase